MGCHRRGEDVFRGKTSMGMEDAAKAEPRTLPARRVEDRGRPVLRLAAAATLAFTCEARGLNSRNVCEAEMLRAARENAVPVGILYAVAMTETGQRGALNAYAMNIDGRAVFNKKLREASGINSRKRGPATRKIQSNHRFTCRINHHYHGARFRGVDHMFDPREAT